MDLANFKLVCLWAIMGLYAAQAVVLFLTGDRAMGFVFAS